MATAEYVNPQLIFRLQNGGATTKAEGVAGEWLRRHFAPHRTEQNADVYDEAFEIYFKAKFSFANFPLAKALIEEATLAQMSKDWPSWNARELAGFYLAAGCDQVDERSGHACADEANPLILEAKYGFADSQLAWTLLQAYEAGKDKAPHRYSAQEYAGFMLRDAGLTHFVASPGSSHMEEAERLYNMAMYGHE